MEKPPSEVVIFLQQCKDKGLTPAQAINRYLASQGKSGIIPPLAKPFIKTYLSDIIALLDFLSNNADWLKEGKNIENLFKYLVVLLSE